MFSSSQEDDRTFCSSNSTESTTTFGMSIKLGYDTRTNINTVFEGFSLTVTSLTNTSIHNKDCSIRLYFLLDLLHFVKESWFLLVSSWSINDDYFVLHLAEICSSLSSNLYWISLFLVSKEGTLDLGCVHFKLLERSSTESISTDESNLPALLHVMEGKFSASSSFSWTLKTYKHYDVLFAALKLIRFVITSQHRGQLSYDSILDESA